MNEPLTRQEMTTTARMVYIETKGAGIDGWYSLHREPRWIVLVNPEGTKYYSLSASLYGVDWRAWPHKPTQEQKEATPWNP